MKSLLSLKISRLSVFWIGVITNKMAHSVGSNSGSPFTVGFHKITALPLMFSIVFGSGSVLKVLGLSTFSKIGNSIIGGITIDMVKVLSGFNAINIPPDKTMGKTKFAANSNNSVTQSVYTTGNTANSTISTRLFPNQVSAVVVKNFVKFSKCNHEYIYNNKMPSKYFTTTKGAVNACYL